VATIVFVRRSDGWMDYLALGLAILAVHVTLFLALRFSGGIIRVIRDSGVTLITRIAGILLSAIAVQLIADAITAFIAEA